MNINTNMNKTSNWSNLPLFKKILLYKKRLGKSESKYVDKLEVKNIVKDILGDEIQVANVIRVLSDYKDIKEEDLNDNYIIKATHGSGWNIDLEKNKDINVIISKLKSWSNKKLTHLGEMQYKYMEPRFFIEEKIIDKFLGRTGNAIVYMLRCIHGNPVTFTVKKGDLANSYDINLKILKPLEFEFDISKIDIEKLKNFAKILSKPFEFVRMDFYIDINDKIYLSEYTFTPAAGIQYYPCNVEKELGKLWT